MEALRLGPFGEKRFDAKERILEEFKEKVSLN
jgi:hypothetical protein